LAFMRRLTVLRWKNTSKSYAKSIRNPKKIHLILERGSAGKYGVILDYLSPYSPNLNPSERLWKIMSENVRKNRYFKTETEFKTAIMHFF